MGRTPDRARGPLLIFRKIRLYGKTKKSTHGHQTAKPFCTHFLHFAPTDQTGHGEFNELGPAAGRGLGRELWPPECEVQGSQVRPPATTNTRGLRPALHLPCTYPIPTLQPSP